jgi:hypothetical protein
MMKALNLLLFVAFSIHVSAQSVLKDSIMPALMLEFNYGFLFPGGDLANRFGGCSAIGPAMKYKTKKNFVIGAEGSFLFGGKVKEDEILKNITTQSGNIIGIEGLFEDFTFSERGFHIRGEIGKIISFKRPNTNSGIYVALGTGFLQHKIRFDVDKGLVPQLNDDYQKGYDRLTNGIAISQFIGYRYFTEYKFLNFFAGIEMTQAFTKNRRSWNFDTFSQETNLRKDFMFGFKAGLVVPIYFQQTDNYYYY